MSKVAIHFHTHATLRITLLSGELPISLPRI